MRKWINLFEDQNSTLYHVTPRANLDAIMKHGLTPEKSKWSNCVYLAGDAPHAIGYVGHHQDDDCVLLTIDVPKLDSSRLQPDDVDLPDCLGEPNEWENFDWRESIQICGQCSYHGIVPPEAISASSAVDIINEMRRGFAPIGEMTAKVFWHPRHSDLIAMLANSKIGDVRGGMISIGSQHNIAIWPARILGHWNFFNECFAREGLDGEDTSFRVCRDLSTLTEEKYWKTADIYRGNGFYCAFHPKRHPALDSLLGDVEIIGSDLTESIDLPWGHGQAGCWITDTGEILPCDYEGDVHHGDIIAQDGGFDEMQDELDQLVDVGHSRGWVRIRIRMNQSNFNVSLNTTVSPAALRTIPRAVDGQTEFHCDIGNATNSDSKSFYADSIGRLMGMIREHLGATR